MKLLRTVRLDASDTFVFGAAAEPGEWAVSGAFVFWDKDPATLDGKARAAFRSGFLGVSSLGWSTLVQIVQTTEAERTSLVALLAEQLVRHFGAPTRAAAKAAAEEEVAFAESLCTVPQDSIIAVHRTYEDGAVRESFRTLRPRDGVKPAPIVGESLNASGMPISGPRLSSAARPAMKRSRVVTARAKKPCRIAARAAGSPCWGNKGRWSDLPGKSY